MAPQSPYRLSEPGPRQVYNYAVVPTGTYTRDDIRTAVLTSPEVEEHYRPVEVCALQGKPLEKDEQAYVSYKKNGKIYWTSYQVTLHEGEMVLSDGKHRIRARCGNRISVEPGEPMLPTVEEPPPEQLRQVETEFQPVTLESAGSSFSWALPVFIPPAFWLPGHSHDPHEPVPEIPEMPAWSYLTMGLALLAGAGALRRR